MFDTTPATAWDRRLLAGLLVTTFVLCVFPVIDTDLWWHLRTGQLIWRLGEVPQVDWFLFTDSNRDWIDLHWGFQLLAAGLYALGGLNAIILFKAAILTLMVGVAWSAAGRGLPAWQRALLWVPGVICISGRAYERPEMLSQLFLACWFWIACRAESRPKWIWALPAIQLLWINVHALFILGLVVGACFAVDFIVRAAAGGRYGLDPLAPEPTSRRLVLAGGLCALAALCNPYFHDGALFPFVLYRKFTVEQDLYSSIGEFQQPIQFALTYGTKAFLNPYFVSQIILFVMAAASFVVLARKRRRWSPFRVLVFVAFSHLGWEATRNANIFAIAASIVLVANVVDLKRLNSSAALVLGAERLRRRERRLPPEDSLPVPDHSHVVAPRERRTNVVVIGLLAVWTVLTVTGVWGRLAGEHKLFGLGERPAWFGHGAMIFAGRPGMPDRALISHIGLAGVYDFHNGPQRLVYMDGRLEVATPGTYARFQQILQLILKGDRSWERELRDENGRLPVIILDTQTNLSRQTILSLHDMGGWKAVYVEPGAVVFLSDADAERLKLPGIDLRGAPQ